MAASDPNDTQSIRIHMLHGWFCANAQSYGRSMNIVLNGLTG